MEDIFLVSIILLMGATGFAVGALMGAFLGRLTSRSVVKAE
jgi:uncharacterized membrane protein